MGDDRVHDGESAIRALSLLIATSDDPFVLTDLDGTVLHANAPALEFPHLAHVVRQQMPRIVSRSPGTRWRGEVSVDDGSMQRTFDVQVVCTEDSLAIHARDISSSVRLHHQLAHLASHDALTDLPNRAHLFRRLTDAIERSRTRHESLTILYVDIDDLKNVNDTLGHECGDVVIGAVARRLVSATRPGDLVARIGGDEFIVLCEGVADVDSAADMAERIRRATSGRVDQPGCDIDAEVSIGVVMYRGLDAVPTPDETADSLLRDADKAMYQAKVRGKARCEIYTEDMRAAERLRAELVADLEHAIERSELFVLHQPIVSPHTHAVVAAEALVRWNHRQLGVLQPTTFVDLADETSMGPAMGTWVVSRAVKDLREWMDEGRVDGRFAVHTNVSRRQVVDPTFVDTVLTAMSDASVRPSQLVLEFGEALVLHDDGRAVRALQSLRRRGVRLSLDDFGSGTSSLAILRTCPVDFVKLDGSLTRGLGEGDDDEPIVRSMIQLAHGFDASVIAESVTTPLQVERLITLGCDLVQGFHIGDPVPAENFATGTATVFPK
jgi:diguanylate cyclase (GGDEF)-like protein